MSSPFPYTMSLMTSKASRSQSSAISCEGPQVSSRCSPCLSCLSCLSSGEGTATSSDTRRRAVKRWTFARIRPSTCCNPRSEKTGPMARRLNAWIVLSTVLRMFPLRRLGLNATHASGFRTFAPTEYIPAIADGLLKYRVLGPARIVSPVWSQNFTSLPFFKRVCLAERKYHIEHAIPDALHAYHPSICRTRHTSW